MHHLRSVRARATVATLGVAFAAPFLLFAPSAGAQGDVCLDTDFGSPRLIDWDGYNPKVEYSKLVPVSLDAGTYDVTGSSFDSYPARVGMTQLSERWEVQFLDAGGSVIGTSAIAPDLADRVETATWKGSLGTVTLSAPATHVRAHHRPDAPADGEANSVVPKGATICGGKVDSSTTVAPTTAPPTTAPPTTAPPTTAPPTSAPVVSVPTPTTAPVKVEGATTTIPGPGTGVEAQTSGPRSPGDNLAATGTTSQSMAGVGLVAFGLGVLILGARTAHRPRRP